MGQNNSDPADPHDNHGSAGWRDDQWGHDFGDDNKVGPHVNAWNDGGNRQLAPVLPGGRRATPVTEG